MIDIQTAVNWDLLEEEERCARILQNMREEGYLYLGTGRHRITFLAPHKRFVLKFPRNMDGLVANQQEQRLWSTRWNFKTQFAPCRLIQGIVLMMRPVVELRGRTLGCFEARKALSIPDNENSDDLPNWSYRIEMRQVGRMANGKWVAYDYGDFYYE